MSDRAEYTTVRATDVSVQDEFEYNNLPDDVKRLCEKQIALRIDDALDAEGRAYDASYQALENAKAEGWGEGYTKGYEDARAVILDKLQDLTGTVKNMDTPEPPEYVAE